MQELRGNAENLRFSTLVEGDHRTTSSSHVAVFEIDGQPIELKTTESIFINQGDEVIVAGTLKRGLLRATAYANKTRHVTGKQSTLGYWIVGLVFCAVLLFLPIGLWLLYTAVKIDRTYAVVRNA